jgi:enoyl-CoA hydratase/carnithine racemase
MRRGAAVAADRAIAAGPRAATPLPRGSDAALPFDGATPVIRSERRDGGVLLVRLDRPQKRNAMDRAMIEALLAALQAAGADSAVAAIVLAGAGGSFSAGADLAEMKQLAADPVARQARSALTVALLEAPARVPKPVVAAVQGAAMGAGASLALSCDAVVMAEDARLAWPEAKHAMLPRLVAPVLLRHLGPKPAFDLLATGRDVGAGEALSLGLATRIAPAATLEDEACALAAAAALLPPEAMGDLKRMVHA